MYYHRNLSVTSSKDNSNTLSADSLKNIPKYFLEISTENPLEISEELSYADANLCVYPGICLFFFFQKYDFRFHKGYFQKIYLRFY